MAIMRPETPREDTESNAEVLLFEAFKALKGNYLIFHSVAWQLRETRNGNKDGEIDFLIVDPKIGFITLEVKGGKFIHRDGVSGEWWSNGNKIKDPIRQSRHAKYSLLTKFRELFPKDLYFNIAYAVAFPEVNVEGDIGLDGPREFLLDAKDMFSLDKWVGNAFDTLSRDANYRSQELSQDFLNKLEDVLCPTRAFSASHANYFAELNQVIERLTEEQFNVINFLQRHRQIAISGCAGSGKTIVAVEKALRLEREGFSVLFLCSNPYLAANIRERVSSPSISVYDINRFVKFLLSNLYLSVHRQRSGCQPGF